MCQTETKNIKCGSWCNSENVKHGMTRVKLEVINFSIKSGLSHHWLWTIAPQSLLYIRTLQLKAICEGVRGENPSLKLESVLVPQMSCRFQRRSHVRVGTKTKDHGTKQMERVLMKNSTDRFSYVGRLLRSLTVSRKMEIFGDRFVMDESNISFSECGKTRQRINFRQQDGVHVVNIRIDTYVSGLVSWTAG